MNDPTLLVCPHCNAANRVPAARLGEKPICGRCKAPLFTGAPIELDSANFDAHIGRSGIPVVVDFWAAWCGPCRSMAPHFAQAAAAMEPGFRFAKVDTDAAQDIAARYAIRSIPTVIVFTNGREIARQSGAMDNAAIRRWLEPLRGATRAA